MPRSDPSLHPWVVNTIRNLDIDTIVDVGAGAGTWYDNLITVFPQAHYTAIEIFPPYVEEFQLGFKYDRVIVNDVRGMFVYGDLVIFGDVLEHMVKDEAIRVWKNALSTSKYLVACLPVTEYLQGPVNGNAHEAHLYHWTSDEFYSEMPGIYWSIEDSRMGAFIARGSQ